MTDQSPRRGVDPRRCARWLPAGLAACLLAAVLPSAASAADYCVDPSPACGPKNIASFKDALSQAESGSDADRIFLGPGPHPAPDAGGFHYDNPLGPVQIIGAGTASLDQTIVTAPAGGSGNVLSLNGGPGTSIHDLMIQIPQNVSFGLAGLRTNGIARDITVRASQTQLSPYIGVVLSGGTLEHASVSAGTPGSYAIYFDAAGGTVRRSAVTGDYGVVAANGGLIERSRVRGSIAGVKASAGTLTIRSSQVGTSGASSAALLANPAAGAGATIFADGVNLIGSNGSQSSAAYALTPAGSGAGAKIALTNSLIRRFPTTLRAHDGGAGPAEIVTSYSDYALGSESPSGPKGSITATHHSDVGDVGFEDAQNGIYELVPGSPLIDAGDPATAQGLDLLDMPLVADGDLDGLARRDIGAKELQPAPPVDGGEPPTGTGGASGGGVAGSGPDVQAPVLSRFAASTARRTRFRYTLSEPARVKITVQRLVRRGGKIRYRTLGRLARSGAAGTNRIRLAGKLGRQVRRAGRYRAIARAADAAGNRSVARRAAFRIAAR